MNQDVLDALFELDADTNGSLLLELIAAYKIEIPRRLPLLRIRADAREAAELGFEAHAMKSTFANFGASAIANLLSSIEIASKRRDWTQIFESISAVDHVVREFEAELQLLENQIVANGRSSAS